MAKSVAFILALCFMSQDVLPGSAASLDSRSASRSSVSRVFGLLTYAMGVTPVDYAPAFKYQEIYSYANLLPALATTSSPLSQYVLPAFASAYAASPYTMVAATRGPITASLLVLQAMEENQSKSEAVDFSALPESEFLSDQMKAALVEAVQDEEVDPGVREGFQNVLDTLNDDTSPLYEILSHIPAVQA